MHEVKEEKSFGDPKQTEIEDKLIQATSKDNGFFVQVAICSIMILGVLFLKYSELNPIFNEKIKKELTQTIAFEDVKQFVYELEEMSDKYWRIK